jgi:hypothetical protein
MRKPNERIRIADSVIASELPADTYVRPQIHDLFGAESGYAGGGKAGGGLQVGPVGGLGTSLGFFRLTA